MKKGFTLIELLAVIVILAVILAIAIPGISGLISNSTKNAFESDAKMFIKAINYKLLIDNSFDITTINETNVENTIGVSNINYQSVSVSTFKGEPYVIIQGENKWNGLTAYGTYQNMNVEDSGNYDTILNQLGYDSSKGVNVPILATGMTPIKWNGTSWVNTTENDTDWYNYDTTNKKWANARTTDGSMWVWIPRYIYNISSGWHSNTTGTVNVQFSKGIDDNWNNASIGSIDIGATSNASNNKWTNHPAFNFGGTQLTGLWIAKFEATAYEGVANGYMSDGSCPIVGDNVITKAVRILPNVRSWRCIHTGNAFTVSRNMETNAMYGWGTSGNGIDTHLMKNTEWGAVSYLTKSQYGKNTEEVYINNSQTYTTGCAGNTVSAAAYNGCQNTYESTGGVKASTTGNIYGIYDLSGGAWEKISAYVDNATGNLNTYGSVIISADNKYKNIYTKGSTDDQPTNYGLTINFKGDAMYETSNNINGSYAWYGESSYMPSTITPWFLRGGFFDYGAGAALYAFGYSSGAPYSPNGFRPVLAVKAGL